MKKTTFYSAFALLIIANLIVFACKKETTSIDNTMPPESKTVTAMNRGLCEDLYIYNGQNLILCGVDGGSGCTVCGGNYGTHIIHGGIEHYPFTTSNSFYVCNPTGATINFYVSFGCVNQSPQSLSLGAGQNATYHLEAGNGCCIAVLGCG